MPTSSASSRTQGATAHPAIRPTTTITDASRTRRSLVSSDISGCKPAIGGLPGLAAIGRVVRIRQTIDKTVPRTATETAYLLSTPLSPQRRSGCPLALGCIENRLHWVLNVVMNEDQVGAAATTAPTI